MHTETHMNLEAAMDLADHASPAPWSASLALKAMRAEIKRLRSEREKAEPVDVEAIREVIELLLEAHTDDAMVIADKLGDAISKAPPAERVKVPDIGSCIWSQDGDDSDTWNTGCRNVFLINDGTPNENGMAFCCYCGKPVEQHLCVPGANHG